MTTHNIFETPAMQQVIANLRAGHSRPGCKLRRYQKQLKLGIYEAWEKGATCAIGVTATGSGKTVTMADMVAELPGMGYIQAHRSQLVYQICMELANAGVRHNITAAKKVVKAIVAAQMKEFGASFYDPRANWTVASVDTIMRRGMANANRVNWVFTDEGHHVLRENKWGKCALMFPNARILLMTATPCRGDGLGLGSHHDGIADALVLGPGLWDLISEGYLTNYETYAPEVRDLDLSDVHITASGEFNQQEVARAVKRSKLIIGDVVEHYLAKARGKLGITFAVDIEHATEITRAYNAAGVPAMLVTAETEEEDRISIMDRFKRRELLQLVNVDLFGEGVDVPGVEVVSMARPTASFSLYAQQIGRMLRLLIPKEMHIIWDTLTIEQRLAYIAGSAKPFGVLLDHVGNVRREYNVGGIKYSGLPEGFTAWTLDRRAKRSRNVNDGIPLRMCTGCHKPYERIFDSCPYCGQGAPEPAERGSPQAVDGALGLIDGEELARMRGLVRKVDGGAFVPSGVPDRARGAILNNHAERQREQYLLRHTMAVWAGNYLAYSNEVNERRFFFEFGIDACNAQALGAREAAELNKRIQEKLTS